MKAFILTIGDELLQGFTLDSNSAWIAQKLLSCGVRVDRKVTIGDELEQIIEAVEYALTKKYDFIFVTGGLGPTHDDVTKAAFKKLFDTEEYFDEEYYQQLTVRFAKRSYKIPDSNRSQAMLLTKSDPIPNSYGTALGMRFVQGDSQIFVMPGVPREMKGMITETIIPKYLPIRKQVNFITLLTTGVPESKLAEDVADILDNFDDGFGFAFLPHHTGVNIRIKAKSENFDFTDIIKAFEQRLGNRIYGQDDEILAEMLGRLLTAEKQTLAVAESCTGGLIAKQLTDIPGSSVYFLGGITTYSNDLKQDLLGVPEDLLIKHGAVSAEVAQAMAEGARRITGADFGIGTTGISGPTGGTQQKPVGLVYISIATKKHTKVKKLHFFKDRILHREMTAQAALDLVRLAILRC